MGIVRQRSVQQLSRLRGYHLFMLILSVLAVILALSVSPYWLVILAIPLLVTPVARELGFIGDGGTKVEFISSQGSYVTFHLILLILASVIIGKMLAGRGRLELADNLFLALFLIPLIYKFFATLSLAYGARYVGLFLGYFIGIIMLIFGLASRGAFVPEIIIAVLTLIVTVASHFIGKLGGGLLTLVGTAYFITLVNRWAEVSASFWLALLFGAPVILAGLLLFFHRQLVGE